MKHTKNSMRGNAALWCILACFLLLLPASAGAVERNYLTSQFTEAEVSAALVRGQAWVPFPAYTDRAGWDSLVGTRRETLIKRGEKRLDYQWQMNVATDYLAYERNGERQIMESKQKANNLALSDLVLAELAEGKGRFLDQIINGVWMECERTSWVLSAHLHRQTSGRNFPDHREQIIDLGSGEVAAFLAWTYYFFREEFDKVNPVIAARLKQTLHERVTVPYLTRDREWWLAFHLQPGQVVNNWNPWCNCNVLQVVMLTEDDEEMVNRCVWRSMQSVDKFMNYVKADGACEEGPAYWGHAAGKLFDYLDVLATVTDGKINLWSNAQVKAMGEYFADAYIGNGWVVNFADATARFSDNISTLLFRYGEAIHSDKMKSLAHTFAQERSWIITNGTDIYRSLTGLACADKVLTYEQPKKAKGKTLHEAWYPETQVCIFEQGDYILASKGGHNNESHNHNDVGTFILYKQGEPVIIDAGVGTYTKLTFSAERYTIWSMQTAYHNLPVVNGVQQHEGAAYHAGEVTCLPRKRTITYDIAPAYPAEAGLKTWARTYRLTAKGLTITNTIVPVRPLQAAEDHLMVRGEVAIDGTKGEIQITHATGTAVAVHFDPQVLTASVERIDLTDPRLTKVWGERIQRIVFTVNHPESCQGYTITID